MMWILAIFFQFLVITITMNKQKGKELDNTDLWFLYGIKTIFSIFAFWCAIQAAA